MKQDTWVDTASGAEYGTTGALGSPRAWLRRALDVAFLDDTTFKETSITPHEISVAGVWYKKPEGYGIPVTGEHRELFRWFDIPSPQQMHRPRNRVPLVPAIGLCAAVPMDQVLHWIRVYKDHGAAYVWWHTPQNRAVRARDVRPQRRQLNHSQVYDMLDAGMKPIDIGRALNFPTPNIDYVAKKWRQGIALKDRPAFLDKDRLFEQSRAGVPVSELSRLFGVSPAYIYNLLKKAA